MPEILAREEARAQVVAAVVALPEALRRVVLLRFYDGLDSGAIGRRLGIPPSTIRSQLQQALATLRRRLDSSHGDRRAAWAIPFASWFAAARPNGLLSLLRVSGPLRAFAGAVTVFLLGWLSAPLWLAAPPPPIPLGPGEVVVTKGPDPSERQAAPVRREPSATEVSTAAARGPEDFWGTVVAAADGSAIAGAEVLLEHRHADEFPNLDVEYGKRVDGIGSARSDAEGHFQFHVERALQHRLTVRANGFAAVVLPYCTGGSEFVVRLERAGFVEGVVHHQDGRPLADVLVDGVERGSIGDGVSTRTAADGSFFLADLPPRPCYVRVRPTSLQAPDWQLIEVQPGAGTRLEFVVAPGRRVHGVVRDAETGLPVPGAAVATNWAMDDAVQSSGDGSYECTGLGLGESLRVRAEGFAEQVLPIDDQADVVVVDVALVRGRSVFGRVLDDERQPLPGARVVAATEEWQGQNRHHTLSRSTTTANDGTFRIDGLARTATTRHWQLSVRAPGFGARVLALPPQQLLQGPIDAGDIELAAQALLEGRFVNADGQPIARAEVRVAIEPEGFSQLLPGVDPQAAPLFHFASRETRTGNDGSFRLAGLGPGRYEVRARIPGKDWDVASGAIEVVAGQLLVVPDLVADGGLTITGRVRIAGQATQLQRSQFVLYAEAEGTESRAADVANDGTFTIERLEAKPYTLFAIQVPAGLAMVPRPAVIAGQKDVEVQLVAAATIEGRVVDHDGQPVRGAGVAFWPAGTSSARNHQTDAAGRFRIEVAPGVVGKLTATDRGGFLRGAAIDNVAAGNRDLVLQLPAR